MAIKAALAAALLVALVAAVSANTYTTVITTTSYDEGGSQGQQCSQQVQGREFQSCQSYLKQRSNADYLDQCCRELKDMDRFQCGCEAIRHAAQKAQHGGSSYQPGQSQGQGQGQGQQIYDKARNLPRLCGLSQQECRLNLVFV